MQRDWNLVKSALAATARPEDWQFWTDWYQASLNGRPMLPSGDADWDMLADIFEVNDTSPLQEEDWENRPDHVNAVIRGIYQDYKARFPGGGGRITPENLEKLGDLIQRAPYAHEIGVDPGRRQLVAIEIDTPNLDKIVSDTRRVVNDFTGRCRKSKGTSDIGAAMLSAYDEAIRLLRRDLRRYKSDPFTLFEQITHARLEFATIARNEGFANEPAHLRLIDGLQRRAGEICAAAPAVLETERERVRVQVALFTEEQRLMALRLCAGMHNDSHGVLRAVSALAVQVILDPGRDETEQRNAWYFLKAAGPRGARAMHEAGVEAASPKEARSTLDKLAAAGDKLSKVDKGVDAVQEIGSEIVDWVTEIISQIGSGNWFGLG